MRFLRRRWPEYQPVGKESVSPSEQGNLTLTIDRDIGKGIMAGAIAAKRTLAVGQHEGANRRAGTGETDNP